MAGKAQRSKPTRSRPARPVQKRYPQTRLETMVLIAVGGVLLVAAVVVLVGLFITQYLPPREHILTIAGQDYNAADVKSRGSYMLRYERDFTEGITQDILVDKTIERITLDEVLRSRAPATVGEVTEDDVEQELRERLGFADPTPTPAASPAPGSTGTPTASPTPTPTEAATPDAEQRQQQEEDFGRARADVYRDAGMSRAKFDGIVTANLLERRLRDQFEAEMSKAAPQVSLLLIRVADEATAQRVRDQALAGSDFVRLAAEYSITPTAKTDGGELGWQLVETLDQPVRDAVTPLAAGAITEIITNDRFFDIYRVAEAVTDRDLDPAQLDTLLQERVDAWFEAERVNVPVELDMSDGEKDWLSDEILADAINRGDPLATPTATSTGTP